MFSLVSGIIGLIAAVIIIVLIRKDHLHVRYGLWWVVIAVAFVVLGFFPQIIDQLAKLLGISYGPALAFTLGLTAFALKLLTLDLARSRNDTRIIRLVQRVSMLESELEKLRSSQVGKESSRVPESTKSPPADT